MIISKSLINKLQLESFDKKSFEDYFESFISKYERRINWLSNIASLSTMTGLLGTVIGILVAFDKMKEKGVASPEIFADGIGIALLTTIMGLSIALPSLFFYYVLNHFVEIIYEKALDKIKNTNEKN
jgi:biopolymer transport protein ExbB/TolQ